jgi:hypothetical protein
MKAEAVEDVASQVNFLVRKCDFCGLELVVGQGDAIFGDRWYHGQCWEGIRIRTPEDESSQS